MKQQPPMGKRKNALFFGLFVSVWAGLIFANLLTPEKKFSETENRAFSAFPTFSVSTLLNGEWMNRIDAYIDEQFIFRDGWIAAQSTLEYGLGKREINGVWVGKNALMAHLAQPREQIAQVNVQGIAAFAARYSMPVRVMLVPSASDICTQQLPFLATSWSQKDTIATLYNGLPQGVQAVPVYDTLRSHAAEDTPLYYRTDHHWTTYGAWLGYTQYCTAAGLSPVPYQADTVSTSFNGTLYSKSGVRFVDSDAIAAYPSPAGAWCEVYDGTTWTQHEDIYFAEYLTQKSKYSYFLGEIQPIVRLHSNAGTGKKLLMFKDSYAHCLAPMLLHHYDEITLVDLRMAQSSLEALGDINRYSETLFLYSLDTFTSLSDLKTLRTSP